MTIVEATLTLCIMTIAMTPFVGSLGQFRDMESASDVQFNLARGASRATRKITRDLSRGGYVDVGGTAYPLTLDEGDAGSLITAFQHPAANDFGGGNDEIVFVLPVDADDDGWPDVLDGEPVWGATRVAYLVVPENDTTNALVRRDENGSSETICRNVAQVVIERPAATGFAIPLDAIRIRITMRKMGSSGHVYEREIEQVIQLRNGGMSI
ncbi:MAG: hypothetical protein GY711_05455 [bacterium]|nr:hypothetical protein [bacterium]